VTLAPLGGANGQRIRAEFAQLGAAAHWTPAAQETRICTTLICNGRHTELVEPAPPLAGDELCAFDAAWRDLAATAQVVVLTGSLPPGTPAPWYRQMLKAAPHARAVIDAQGAALLAAAQGRPLVVKPNRHELAECLHRPLRNDAELAEAMHELRQLGAEWVVVTDGPRSVHAMGPVGRYQLQPPRVARVVNPIGCGDCLAAGLAWGLARGTDMLGALKLGLACAADRLGTMLPGRLDAARVEQLARAVEVGPA
jgi:1-phosphofructokinase family hexose kinase